MYPQLDLAAGGVAISVASHALAIAVGTAVGATLVARRAGAEPRIPIAVALVAAVGLAGSHALFAALHGGSLAGWTGGLMSTGGVAAGLVATAIAARMTRIRFRVLLDALAPGALVALAIGRIGCFLGGCCFGGPTALPWGVVFPELGPPARHPLQLYSAAGDALVAWASIVAGAPPGAAGRRASIGLGALRFALEFLRDPAATDRVLAGWLTLPQAASLALVAWAFFGLRPSGGFDYGSAPEGAHG